MPGRNSIVQSGKAASEQTIGLARKMTFSSAHFYEQKAFSEADNRKTFGPCYSAYGHGHNYVLEVFLSGVMDQESGMVMNLMDVDAQLRVVVKELDHKHLNFEIPYFKTNIPTTENILLFLWPKVQACLKNMPVRLDKLRLFEDEDLWAECGI